MEQAIAPLEVAHFELTQLFASDAVIERRVARIARSRWPLSVSAGGASRSARACSSPRCRRGPFVTLRLQALDPLDGVMGDGIAVTQILKKGGQGGELAPDGR
jgi:hypothetical protein